MEPQRQLDEPELSGLDPIGADLRLAEPDLAGFLPGEESKKPRSGGRGAPSPGEGAVWRCRRRIGWQGNQAPAQQAPWTVPAPRRGGEAFSVKSMSSHAPFTLEQARAAGVRIGIDWDASLFSLEQFRMGLDVELEHGTRDPATNVTDDDVLMTAKIARAHLNEFPDYYTRLAKMEAQAEADWTTPGD